jgi:hypothetical protein
MAGSTSDAADQPLRDAASSVVQLTAAVFAELARLGDEAVGRLDLLEHPAFADPHAWDALEPVVVSVLHDQAGVTGAGLAVLPPASDPAGSVPSMAWWVLRDGEVRAKQHVLNPRSDSFYDITQARWFRVPYGTGTPTLLPPYVDSWGTDDVTMTAAVPLRIRGEVAGVVACDLDARRYVDAVERILARVGAAALVDEDERVVASTHPGLEVGTRRTAADGRSVRARAGIGEFGWAIVRL